MHGLGHGRGLVGGALLLGACLEPNPNLDGGTGGTGGTDDSTATSADSATSDSATSDGTGDTGEPEPPSLLIESVSFEAGDEGFMASVPKPSSPHTAPIAFIQTYAPGNSDNLGYAVTWTDAGDSYTFELSVTGTGNNSRVGGVAVVLGLEEAPEIVELELLAGDGCTTASVGALDGRVLLDSVERYAPGDDLVLAYTSSPAADGVELCVTSSDTAEAALGFKAIAFPIPTGVELLEVPETTMESASPQSTTYPELGAGAAVHLIGARTFDEATASNLGFNIGCDPAAPYGCSYDLSGFKAGARVVAGGLIVVSP